MTRISVIGLGKLGAPMLAVFVEAGFQVICVDVKEEVVEAINAGKVPGGIVEPGVQEILSRYRPDHRLYGEMGAMSMATTHIQLAVEHTDVTFVVVPTPSGNDDGFVLDFIRPIARHIGKTLRNKEDRHVVVITSTVMPGQAREISNLIARSSGKKPGREFAVVYSPEFIRQGSIVRDFQCPDDVLIGSECDWATDRVVAVYRAIHDAPIEIMGWESAEIAKMARNSFITMKIAFANEIGRLCGAIPGADVDDVLRSLGHDRRIGPHYLRAGTAYGGPCFPRDNRALQRAALNAGVELYAPCATDNINERTKLDLARTIYAAPGNSIGIMGLAFKPGTNIVEESASLYVISALREIDSDCRIVVHDPLAMGEARKVLKDSVDYVPDAAALVQQSDVIVLMHPDAQGFAHQFEPELQHKAVIDPWRVAPFLRYAAKRYIGLGAQ